MKIRVPIERTSIPVDGSDIRRKKQLQGKVVHPRVLAPSKRGLASELLRLVTMKLYVCQMPSTQFMEEIVLPRLGVDGCLLKLMLSFKKHKSGGCTLALQDLVFVFFEESGSAQKKNDPPRKKLKGIVSPGILFSKQMILNSDLIARFYQRGMLSAFVLGVFLYSIHHGFLIFFLIFFGTQLLLNYCKQLAVSQVSRWKNNLSSIPLCYDCR